MAATAKLHSQESVAFERHNGALPQSTEDRFVGRLGDMEDDEEEEEEEGPLHRPEDVLLKTKFLTFPGYRTTRNQSVELRTWASSDPEIKETNVSEGREGRK